MSTPAFLDTDLRLGRVTVLVGEHGGRYPAGNSLLVQGTSESVLVDPSVSVVQRGGAPLPVDRILLSHAHEDHMAGNHLFPRAAVHAHHDDLVGVRSLEGLFTVYTGDPTQMEPEFARTIVEEFTFVGRPDAVGFADGDTFDLGGGVRVEVVHLPGHTRGHCGFLIEPDGVFFVADVDLSAFGPYYGDHWSDLEDFERAIDRAREVDARWYATFHHKGVIEGRPAFVEQLDAFAAVIARREHALLEFLAEPRTMGEIVAHRFVYRPGVELSFIDRVEQRHAELHLTRLARDGRVTCDDEGRWRAVPGTA